MQSRPVQERVHAIAEPAGDAGSGDGHADRHGLGGAPEHHDVLQGAVQHGRALDEMHAGRRQEGAALRLVT